MDSKFNLSDPRRQASSSVASSGRWKCLPCHEGLATIPETSLNTIRQLQADNPNTAISTKLFDGRLLHLPKGVTEDILLNEPPFILSLDDSEIRELSTERDESSLIFAVAATSYGPPAPAQDKKSNEDYAISAIIRKPDGEEWAFAAVSDGVSTKTFWAARTSRIACLVAFKVFRRFISSNSNIFDDATLENLQETLVKNLRDELRCDKLNLLEYKGTVPSNWAPEMYESHKDRDELWYNATLLVTCLGPQFGFITFAGDGGIELVKIKKSAKTKSGNGADVKEVLRSSEDLTIHNFVSLGVSSKDFRAARITYDDDIAGVEVILSSDGVDRTLQLNSANISYQHLRLDSSANANEQLHELLKLPRYESDNFSVARAARYSEKVIKVPQPHTDTDNSKRYLPTTVDSGEKHYSRPSTPPAKRRINRYVILSFIIGCCVGVGSTLGVMQLRRNKSRGVQTKIPTTETNRPATETENTTHKEPTTANVNNQNTENRPDQKNENKAAEVRPPTPGNRTAGQRKRRQNRRLRPTANRD